MLEQVIEFCILTINMSKKCICGKLFLPTHIKRHQISCKEYYASQKTEEVRAEYEQKLKKSEELVSMLHTANVNTFQRRIDTLELQLKEKDDEIRRLENALIQRPTYKNCNVNNVNNNTVVLVNAWGNETFDHITEEDKIRALRNYVTAIPNIVEQIHFGAERKNRNVKLPNKRGREVLIHKELPDGEVKQVHEDLNNVLEVMIANGKYVLDPVAEKLNMTRYKKFREDLRESERIKSKLYAEQKSAVKRKLMDNACE